MKDANLHFHENGNHIKWDDNGVLEWSDGQKGEIEIRVRMGIHKHSRAGGDMMEKVIDDKIQNVYNDHTLADADVGMGCGDF